MHAPLDVYLIHKTSAVNDGNVINGGDVELLNVNPTRILVHNFRFQVKKLIHGFAQKVSRPH